MKLLAILLTLVIAQPAYADDKAAAEAAFIQAKQLAKDGKWIEACPLFEASYHADPGLGALLNLADCHEHIGLTATAWAEFRDVQDIARKKGDQAREDFAKAHVDGLAPKLDRLRLVKPTDPIAGFIVRRDGTDITALIGTDMPIDPGPHELVASAPGFVAWKHTVTITGEGQSATVDLPALDKQVAPAVPQGTLRVTTQADAQILLDSKPMGVGHFEGPVNSGGHTLRVVAPKMRPYQSEVLVRENEVRAIDVPLEAMLVVPRDDGPGFELGLSVAPGVWIHGDRPAVIAERFEISKIIGKRTYLGIFAELGSISAQGACGSDLPGPTPTTPFDFGARNQFLRCFYLMPGLELFVHILPGHRFDPYVGLAPGFRFSFIQYNSAAATMMAGNLTTHDTWPGIVTGIRAGIETHPAPSIRSWKLGVFVESEVTILGQESDRSNNNGDAGFVTLIGGLRSMLEF